VHAFLDDDQSGRSAGKKAVDATLLKLADLNYAKFPGKLESEFEDFVKRSAYDTAFLREFEIDVNAKIAGIGKQKWSDEMKVRFERAGKQWDDSTKMMAKQLVVAGCFQLKKDAFYEIEHDATTNLIAYLERKLK